MRILSNPKYSISVVILFLAVFAGCNKDKLIPIEKVKTSDMYGAWSSVYSADETRFMLFFKNNDAYSDAADNNGIVILSVTPTDTTILYAGTFEIVDGYLHTFNDASNYANEIIEFSKARYVLYSDSATDLQRTWEKTETDLLDTAP